MDAVTIFRRQAIEKRRENAAFAVKRQLEIVPDRMTLENGRLLELAADAELGNIGLVPLGEIDLAVEEHFALVGPRLAGDDVHHRRFAGAVRADDGAKFPGLDDDRQRIQRLETVEGDGDVVEIEHAVGLDVRDHGLTPPPEWSAIAGFVCLCLGGLRADRLATAADILRHRADDALGQEQRHARQRGHPEQRARNRGTGR